MTGNTWFEQYYQSLESDKQPVYFRSMFHHHNQGFLIPDSMLHFLGQFQTDGIKNLRFLFTRKIDTFCIAAALDIKDAIRWTSHAHHHQLIDDWNQLIRLFFRFQTSQRIKPHRLQCQHSQNSAWKKYCFQAINNS